MKDEDKTKEQLINELIELRRILKDQQNITFVPETTSIYDQFFLSYKYGCQKPVNYSRKHHISQLIDIPLLQQLFDSFYEMTGIMHALLDVDTNILTRTGWTDICLNFHRICPQTECRCKQSDSFISKHLQDGPYIRYKCLNGLIDYATPIIVEGQHLATIYMGQLLNEPPNEEYFRLQAREFGFDETAYIKALHKVNIVPEYQIEPIMEFYSKLGQVLASLGLERLRRVEEAETNFLKAFNCFPDPATITTIETGSYVDMNDAWVETTGYEKHEAIGRSSTTEMGVYLDLEARNHMIEEIQAKGYVRNVETFFRMKAGDVRTFLTSLDLVIFDNKQHLLGVHKDITERIHTEKALRESEEKFSKAFHCNPDLMAISSLEEGRYIEVNDAFMKITGYKRHEVIGRTVKELNIWTVPEQRDYLIEQLKAHGRIRGFELDLRKKSGEIRKVSLSGDIIDLYGEPHLLNSSRDITEIKRIEKELARLDRLHLIGEMAASIGHEIRNPMTSIRGFLQLLRGNDYNAKDRMYFDLMIEELDRANNIISEYLDMAKDKRVNLQPQYLNEVITSLYPIIKADANYLDMDVRLDLGEPEMILIDEKEIRQMILNMARNGLEAMSSGGILTIGTILKAKKIVLFVKDSGHGLDSDLLDKLGTPFLTTKEKGTGLGLAVCYSIATRHNARIDLETGPEGTTFFIQFPGCIF